MAAVAGGVLGGALGSWLGSKMADKKKKDIVRDYLRSPDLAPSPQIPNVPDMPEIPGMNEQQITLALDEELTKQMQESAADQREMKRRTNTNRENTRVKQTKKPAEKRKLNPGDYSTILGD